MTFLQQAFRIERIEFRANGLGGSGERSGIFAFEPD